MLSYGKLLGLDVVKQYEINSLSDVNKLLDYSKGLSKKRLYSDESSNTEVGFDTKYKQGFEALSERYQLDPSYLNNVMNSMDALT